MARTNMRTRALSPYVSFRLSVSLTLYLSVALFCCLAVSLSLCRRVSLAVIEAEDIVITEPPLPIWLGHQAKYLTEFHRMFRPVDL